MLTPSVNVVQSSFPDQLQAEISRDEASGELAAAHAAQPMTRA